MPIGENIKRLRESNNMRQEDLAQALGVTDGAVSSWEGGRVDPRMGKVRAMAMLFRVDVSDIIEDKKTLTPEGAGDYELTEQDQALLEIFRGLSDEDKGRMLERAEILAAQNREQAPPSGKA